MKQKKSNNPAKPLDLGIYFKESTLGNIPLVYEKIERQILTAPKLEIHPRVFHSWVNAVYEKKKRYHVKYSFVDYVFFKIMEQLKEFDTPNLIIKNLKENLLSPINYTGVLLESEFTKKKLEQSNLQNEEKLRLIELLKEREKEKNIQLTNLNWLHLIITQFITNRSLETISVFKDGSFIYKAFDEQNRERLMYETFITVSISGIMKLFLISELANSLVPELHLLNRHENEIFEHINKNDFVNVSIYDTNKKIKPLVIEKGKQFKENLINAIINNTYSEVIFKNRKGEVIKIENKVRIVL